MNLTSLSILNKIKDGSYINQEITRKAHIFNMYERFYLGTQYDSEFIKRFYQLYASTREFYSLITRAVDIDVQLIPGNWTTTNNQNEIDIILENSNWNKFGHLFVHFGVLFGDIYLKLYDDDGVIKIQPLDPRGIWLDDEKVIIIRNITNKSGQLIEHSEIITVDFIKIFENAKEVFSSPNPFNLIPVIYGQNKNVGLNVGLNTFHNVIDEVNAVNEMATFLQEQTLRALVAQKVITGAQPGQVDFGNDRTIFLPKDTKLDVLDSNIEISDTLKFLQDIKEEVKESLPELVLDRVSNPNLERPTSAASLQLQLFELTTKIKRLRLGYDDTLKRAVNTSRVMSGQTELDFEFDNNRTIIELATEVSQI